MNSSNNKKLTTAIAITSTLSAIVGFFILPLSIAAIILGHFALINKEQKQNKTVQTYAKIGLYLGYGWLIFATIAGFLFLMFVH